MVGMLLRYTISYDRRKGGLLGESPFANPQPFCSWYGLPSAPIQQKHPAVFGDRGQSVQESASGVTFLPLPSTGDAVWLSLQMYALQ